MVKCVFIKDFRNVGISNITETSFDLEINSYYKMLNFVLIGTIVMCFAIIQ